MLSFFPLDVLDEIWDAIESVSEGFLTYSCLFLVHSGSTGSFLLFQYFSGVVSHRRISRCHNTLFLSSPHL